MGRLLLILVLCMLFAVLSGCQERKEPPKNSAHGANSPAVKADMKAYDMVDVVKNSVSDKKKTKSVGKAFDEYPFFTKREWKKTTAQNQTVYVDFVGLLDTKVIDARAKKEGVVDMAVDIKFVVKPDGTNFVGMITFYDTKTGGKTYPVPLPAVAGVMNAIYANAELPPL